MLFSILFLCGLLFKQIFLIHFPSEAEGLVALKTRICFMVLNIPQNLKAPKGF